MTLTLRVLIQLVALIALVWFAYRLLRSPRDHALRAVVACLATRVAGAPFVANWLVTHSGGLVSPAAAKLLLNLLLTASWYSLMLFFLFAAVGTTRRAWRETILMAAVAVVMTTALLATPDAAHAYPSSGAIPDQMAFPVPVFYLAGAGYFAYATAQASRWALRYARESSHRTRLGLRIAAAGMAGTALLALFRATTALIRWVGGTVPSDVAHQTDQLVPWAILVFIIGVCVAGLAARIAALRVWARHRRLYHELRPLWTLLHEAFPRDALERGHRGLWRDRLSPRRIHRRFWRRVVEIRDGLVQLSPHLRDAGFSPEQPASEQAGTLREALRRQHEGVRPSSSSAVLIAAPPRDDLDSDIDQLVTLARALSSSQTLSPSQPQSRAR